jgi:uncharacterized protein YjbI with pentapeptide repeats
VAKASYVEGLTVEGDEFPPRLTIDGRPVAGVNVDDEGFFVVSNGSTIRARTLQELGRHLVNGSPALRERRRALRDQHFAELQRGVRHWNQWRLENQATRPLLFGLDLRASATGLSDLSGADFANANLITSHLDRLDLRGANFHEANLGGASLCGAVLTGANFCRTDLYATDLSGATLCGANLQGTQVAMTVLNGAHLIGCKIYGMSAWDVVMDRESRQQDLVIVYKTQKPDAGGIGGREVEESTILVDNLEAAQFVYLMLNNPKIAPIIDTAASKVVLILGRFSSERKAVLDGVRDELRNLKYIPVLFDFSQPDSRDVTDTVKLLAQMALFVIADLTDPSSSPFELQNIYDATSVPIQTVILQGHRPFSMFWDLVGKAPNRVLPPFKYRDPLHLVTSLGEKVVGPSLAAARAQRDSRKAATEKREAFETEQT